MAKKQKSFAEKAAGQGGVDATWVKYVKSVKSEQTGKYRFNEQMIGLQGGESLDAALKRLDETSNLVDIDLSEFIAQQSEEIVEEVNEVESKVKNLPIEQKQPVLMSLLVPLQMKTTNANGFEGEEGYVLLQAEMMKNMADPEIQHNMAAAMTAVIRAADIPTQ